MPRRKRERKFVVERLWARKELSDGAIDYLATFPGYPNAEWLPQENFARESRIEFDRILAGDDPTPQWLLDYHAHLTAGGNELCPPGVNERMEEGRRIGQVDEQEQEEQRGRRETRRRDAPPPVANGTRQNLRSSGFSPGLGVAGPSRGLGSPGAGDTRREEGSSSTPTERRKSLRSSGKVRASPGLGEAGPSRRGVSPVRDSGSPSRPFGTSDSVDEKADGAEQCNRGDDSLPGTESPEREEARDGVAAVPGRDCEKSEGEEERADGPAMDGRADNSQDEGNPESGDGEGTGKEVEPAAVTRHARSAGGRAGSARDHSAGGASSFGSVRCPDNGGGSPEREEARDGREAVPGRDGEKSEGEEERPDGPARDGSGDPLQDRENPATGEGEGTGEEDEPAQDVSGQGQRRGRSAGRRAASVHVRTRGGSARGGRVARTIAERKHNVPSRGGATRGRGDPRGSSVPVVLGSRRTVTRYDAFKAQAELDHQENEEVGTGVAVYPQNFFLLSELAEQDPMRSEITDSSSSSNETTWIKELLKNVDTSTLNMSDPSPLIPLFNSLGRRSDGGEPSSSSALMDKGRKSEAGLNLPTRGKGALDKAVDRLRALRSLEDENNENSSGNDSRSSSALSGGGAESPSYAIEQQEGGQVSPSIPGDLNDNGDEPSNESPPRTVDNSDKQERASASPAVGGGLEDKEEEAPSDISEKRAVVPRNAATSSYVIIPNPPGKNTTTSTKEVVAHSLSIASRPLIPTATDGLNRTVDQGQSSSRDRQKGGSVPISSTEGNDEGIGESSSRKKESALAFPLIAKPGNQIGRGDGNSSILGDEKLSEIPSEDQEAAAVMLQLADGTKNLEKNPDESDAVHEEVRREEPRLPAEAGKNPLVRITEKQDEVPSDAVASSQVITPLSPGEKAENAISNGRIMPISSASIATKMLPGNGENVPCGHKIPEKLEEVPPAASSHIVPGSTKKKAEILHGDVNPLAISPVSIVPVSRGNGVSLDQEGTCASNVKAAIEKREKKTSVVPIASFPNNGNGSEQRVPEGNWKEYNEETNRRVAMDSSASLGVIVSTTSGKKPETQISNGGIIPASSVSIANGSACSHDHNEGPRASHMKSACKESEKKKRTSAVSTASSAIDGNRAEKSLPVGGAKGDDDQTNGEVPMEASASSHAVVPVLTETRNKSKQGDVAKGDVDQSNGEVSLKTAPSSSQALVGLKETTESFKFPIGNGLLAPAISPTSNEAMKSLANCAAGSLGHNEQARARHVNAATKAKEKKKVVPTSSSSITGDGARKSFPVEGAKGDHDQTNGKVPMGAPASFHVVIPALAKTRNESKHYDGRIIPASSISNGKSGVSSSSHSLRQEVARGSHAKWRKSLTSSSTINGDGNNRHPREPAAKRHKKEEEKRRVVSPPEATNETQMELEEGSKNGEESRGETGVITKFGIADNLHQDDQFANYESFDVLLPLANLDESEGKPSTSFLPSARLVSVRTGRSPKGRKFVPVRSVSTTTRRETNEGDETARNGKSYSPARKRPAMANRLEESHEELEEIGRAERTRFPASRGEGSSEPNQADEDKEKKPSDAIPAAHTNGSEKTHPIHGDKTVRRDNSKSPVRMRAAIENPLEEGGDELEKMGRAAHSHFSASQGEGSSESIDEKEDVMVKKTGNVISPAPTNGTEKTECTLGDKPTREGSFVSPARKRPAIEKPLEDSCDDLEEMGQDASASSSSSFGDGIPPEEPEIQEESMDEEQEERGKDPGEAATSFLAIGDGTKRTPSDGQIVPSSATTCGESTVGEKSKSHSVPPTDIQPALEESPSRNSMDRFIDGISREAPTQSPLTHSAAATPSPPWPSNLMDHDYEERLEDTAEEADAVRTDDYEQRPRSAVPSTSNIVTRRDGDEENCGHDASRSDSLVPVRSSNEKMNFEDEDNDGHYDQPESPMVAASSNDGAEERDDREVQRAPSPKPAASTSQLPGTGSAPCPVAVPVFPSVSSSISPVTQKCGVLQPRTKTYFLWTKHIRSHLYPGSIPPLNCFWARSCELFQNPFETHKGKLLKMPVDQEHLSKKWCTIGTVEDTHGPWVKVRALDTDKGYDEWYLAEDPCLRPLLASADTFRTIKDGSYPDCREPSKRQTVMPFDKRVLNSLRKNGAVPVECFAHQLEWSKEPKVNYFKVDDKLETYDHKNGQGYFSPATVVEVGKEHIRIHLDGLSDSYDTTVSFKDYRLLPCGYAGAIGWVCKMEEHDTGKGTTANHPISRVIPVTINRAPPNPVGRPRKGTRNKKPAVSSSISLIHPTQSQPSSSSPQDGVSDPATVHSSLAFPPSHKTAPRVSCLSTLHSDRLTSSSLRLERPDGNGITPEIDQLTRKRSNEGEMGATEPKNRRLDEEERMEMFNDPMEDFSYGPSTSRILPSCAPSTSRLNGLASERSTSALRTLSPGPSMGITTNQGGSVQLSTTISQSRSSPQDRPAVANGIDGPSTSRNSDQQAFSIGLAATSMLTDATLKSQEASNRIHAISLEILRCPSPYSDRIYRILHEQTPETEFLQLPPSQPGHSTGEMVNDSLTKANVMFAVASNQLERILYQIAQPDFPHEFKIIIGSILKGNRANRN